MATVEDAKTRMLDAVADARAAAMGGLSHVDEHGAARMVDVGDKAVTTRVARAGARIWMAPHTMDLLMRQALPKGDVLAVARVAGIMAAKKTSELVPLCHPLALSNVEVSFAIDAERCRIDIECLARTEGRTGVEMEALTGACVAAITIYDMAKAVDREMVIGDLRLLEKSGGKEHYVREEEATSGSGGSATLDSETASSVTAASGAPRSDTAVTAGPAAFGSLPRGIVVSVNVSPGKGERKKPVPRVILLADHGIEGDGHAGPWHRQVSLLAQESIDKMVAKGLDVGAGDFAENITTQSVDLCALPLGTRLELGTALVELTQLGKVCHDRCAIYYQAGDCVMPREGIFVRVLRGGEVVPGDAVAVVSVGTGAVMGADGEPVAEEGV